MGSEFDNTGLHTVQWVDGKVRLIDQTALPARFAYVDLNAWQDVVEAIRTMIVRGAPAIGCTAALGLALGAKSIDTNDREPFLRELGTIADRFRASRPTAVNLFWAVDRLMNLATASDAPPAVIAENMLVEARTMLHEDIETNRTLGRYGAERLPENGTVLTHCNAGALATVSFGTALGVIRAAIEAGKKLHIFADETRPRLQGMKLTAWELAQDGIPVTIIADNMAASLMRQGKIDCVVVGADRIAANGDTANKIGTYSLAVVARHHGVPFYVAAPYSTIDSTLPTGDLIPIEQRSDSEMTHIDGVRIAPEGVPVLNPSFDVTPAELITGIVTEYGVLEAPYELSIAQRRR